MASQTLPNIKLSLVTLLDLVGGGVPTPIGTGSTAIVYKASIPMPDGTTQIAAVKLYNPGTSKQVRREISALARLNDRTVVKAYALITDDEHPDEVVGVASELMHSSLTQYVKARSRSDLELVSIIDVACRSVQFLHSQDIAHGDIKPDNFLVTKDGGPKICDLGSAHILATLGGATMGTGMRGSPLFMAPELAMGGRPTKAGDVFAVGMLMWALYHIDAVAVPFGDDVLQPLQVMMALIGDKRPPIGNPVPAGVVQLIRDCWQQDPAKRPDIRSVSQRVRTILAAFSPIDAPTMRSHAKGPHTVFTSPDTFSPPADLLPSIEALLPAPLRERLFSQVVAFVDQNERSLKTKYPGLTRNHIAALHAYTVSSGTREHRSIFAVLNELLSQRPSMDDDAFVPYLPLHHYLLDALQFLPLTPYKYVFRGYRKAKLSSRPTYTVGNHVYLIAYTSTSTSHSVMVRFAGADGTLMMVTDAKGYPIDEFSVYGEAEVLLPPNTHIEVKQVLSGEAATHMLLLAKGETPFVTPDLVVTSWHAPSEHEHPLPPSPVHDDNQSGRGIEGGGQPVQTPMVATTPHPDAAQLLQRGPRAFAHVPIAHVCPPEIVIAWARELSEYAVLLKAGSTQGLDPIATPAMADAACEAAQGATSAEAVAELFSALTHVIADGADPDATIVMRMLLVEPVMVTRVCDAVHYATSPRAVEALFRFVAAVVGSEQDDTAAYRRTAFSRPGLVAAVSQAEPLATTSSALEAVFLAVHSIVMPGGDLSPTAQDDERVDAFRTPSFVHALCRGTSRATSLGTLRLVLNSVQFLVRECGPGSDARLNAWATPEVVSTLSHVATHTVDAAAITLVFTVVMALTERRGSLDDITRRQNVLATPAMAEAVVHAARHARTTDAIEVWSRAVTRIVAHSVWAVDRGRATVFIAPGLQAVAIAREYAATTEAKELLQYLEHILNKGVQ